MYIPANKFLLPLGNGVDKRVAEFVPHDMEEIGTGTERRIEAVHAPCADNGIYFTTVRTFNPRPVAAAPKQGYEDYCIRYVMGTIVCLQLVDIVFTNCLVAGFPENCPIILPVAVEKDREL